MTGDDGQVQGKEKAEMIQDIAAGLCRDIGLREQREAAELHGGTDRKEKRGRRRAGRRGHGLLAVGVLALALMLGGCGQSKYERIGLPGETGALAGRHLL